MKTYIIPVRNTILDPKHRKAIGVALWEFLWMIDRTTREKDGIGIVLGGRPIRYQEIAETIGVHKDTVETNVQNLVAKGYLGQVRTPYGSRFTVLKSAKFISREQEKPPVLVSSEKEKPPVLSNEPEKTPVPEQEVSPMRTGESSSSEQEKPPVTKKTEHTVTGLLKARTPDLKPQQQGENTMQYYRRLCDQDPEMAIAFARKNLGRMAQGT